MVSHAMSQMCPEEITTCACVYVCVCALHTYMHILTSLCVQESTEDIYCREVINIEWYLMRDEILKRSKDIY